MKIATKSLILKISLTACLAVAPSVMGAVDENTIPLDVEKPNLHFGFIKLTDCAPLVIAKEKGFFEAEGLNVKLTAQKNWVILLDNVINRRTSTRLCLIVCVFWLLVIDHSGLYPHSCIEFPSV